MAIDSKYLFEGSVLVAACFLFIEAVFTMMNESKNKSPRTIDQATVWIRSMLMVFLSVVLFVLIMTLHTSSAMVPS